MASLIQSGILYPLTQLAFDNSQAGNTVPTKPTLLIAQSLVAQPLAIVPVFSISQAQNLFGASSQMARMFAFYFNLDPLGPIYCLPIPDPSGGAAATGSLVFSTPTPPYAAAGTISLYIAGQNVQVAIPAGTAAAGIPPLVVAAISANPNLPVTATVDVALNRKVDLVSRHLGTLGNDIDLRVNYYGPSNGEALPAGVTLAIASMSGGTGVPTLTAVPGIVGDGNYRVIVHPFSDAASMAVFSGMMNFAGGRWSPTRKSWGHCFTSRSDLATNLVTYNAGANDPHSTVYEYETGSPSPVWEAAAIFAGAAAPSLRQQPNQPLQTLQLVGMLAPNASGAVGTETAWNATVWQTLLGTGGALGRYDTAGNAYILRAVTTYTTNSYGQPDQSYLDTETLYLLMAQSDYLSSTITQQLGRVLVADNGTVFNPGVPVVTPNIVKAMLVAAYNDMQGFGWVEDASAFIAACSVQRDPFNTNMLDILFTPYNVVGLRQVGITNQFRQFSAAVQAVQLAA